MAKKKDQHDRAPLADSPGNHKGKKPITPTGEPLKLPSIAENEALLEMVIEMLAMRKRRWEIRAAVEAALGYKVHFVTFNKIVAAAQRRQVEAYKQDRDIHLGNAHTFYEAAIREAPEWKDKLAAQAGLNAIHGLVFNDKRNPQMTDEERQEMYKKLIEGLRESTENTNDPIADDEEAA
jgi:hypothetical protein